MLIHPLLALSLYLPPSPPQPGQYSYVYVVDGNVVTDPGLQTYPDAEYGDVHRVRGGQAGRPEGWEAGGLGGWRVGGWRAGRLEGWEAGGLGGWRAGAGGL